ncbi:MAG: EAL domain-containing protein [Bacteroidia bacterium]|nr:EAL domain-containing protein [Methylotenera sp.]
MREFDSSQIKALLQTADETYDSVSQLLPLFQWIFDASQDNVSVTDADAIVIYVNPTLSRSINLPLSDIIGARAKDRLNKEVGMAKYIEAIRTVIATGISESVFVATSSESYQRLIYDTIKVSPIFNREGKLIGTLAVGRNDHQSDVNEINNIKQREIYQRALLDNFPFMVWLKDKKSRYLATNSLVASLVGATTTDALLGTTDFDHFAESIAQSFVDGDLEVLSTGITKSHIESIELKNGEKHWFETYKSPVVMHGEIIGTVGYSRDIGEQIKLQREVAKKELEYAELVQSLPLSIVRYDRQCRRVFINSHCAQNDQACIDAILGKTPTEYWHQHVVGMTGQQFEEILQHVMRSEQAKAFEIEVQSDQISLVYLFNILPEKNSRGQVVGALTMASDITENSHNRQRIEHLAFHDALTDLPNRALLNERIVFAVGHAERYGEQFGVLFLDLDNFKAINDTLGHAVGDRLLQEIGRRLSACVRNYDTVARMGGDEFAILVSDIKSVEDLASLASHIVRQFELPFQVSGTDFFVTMSVGVASYPDDGNNAIDLLKYADSAMYVAKKNGGNNYQFYTHELTIVASRHLKIETLLRYALTQQEFELYYQPIFLLKDKTMIGAEALIRWHSKELGFVEPDQFISVAEERGLILDIGRWVMESAFQAAAKWNKLLVNSTSVTPIVISINISSKQLMQQDFISIVQALLQETQCNPAWIKFEITESLLLHETVTVKNTLRFLNALGIKISIDDFGTGYSALGYLNKFSVSEIKIDRSFIKDITTDENHALLVKSIIAMAISLDKTLIAEGVETQAQAKLIYDFGCNVAQGFLFSAPISAANFELMLIKSK